MITTKDNEKVNYNMEEAMEENKRCDMIALQSLGYKSIEDFIENRFK